MIQLGDRVRDRISGLKGIAVSRTEFLYGCVRVAVQAEETKDGKPADATWIDEPQLELVKTAVVARPAINPPAAPRRHGPRADAQRPPDARR